MDKVKKNVAYNIAYQVLIYIIPLVTAPYLARTIGADGVGIFSFTYSIVYYFMMITVLGLNNYGSKCIAQCGDDKQARSKLFWNLYVVEVAIGFLMLAIYLGYVFIANPQYKEIALLQSLLIVSSIMDINWLFFGLEEFKLTVTRNALVKFSSLVLIFILVKSEKDLPVYTAIMAGTPVISQLIMWAFARKRIVFVKPEWQEMKKHLLPNLIMFVPAISGPLFKMMDKIMLGILSTFAEVGYYENAEKIISVPILMITALGTVMLPRMSSIAMGGKKGEEEKYIATSMDFAMFMSSAMCFGLMAVGQDFSVLYFGKDFARTGLLIVLLASTIPIFSFANVIRSQYLIPHDMDKVYLKAIGLGSLVNMVLNFVLIPLYTGAGACIATVIAELVVTVVHARSVKGALEIKKYLFSTALFVLTGLMMFGVVYSLGNLQTSAFVRLLIQIFIGVVVYFMLNARYIKQTIDIKSIIKKH